MFRFTALLLFVLLIFGCNPPNKKFAPVVHAIQSGALAMPANGVITLSHQFAGLTARNEVFAEKKADGRLLILFPTKYGGGQDVKGYLYCSGPLQPADHYTIDHGSGGKHQYLDVAGRTMLTAKSYKTNWYLVSRRLD
jgi:hypothetical protein